MTGSRGNLSEYQGPVTYGGSQVSQGNQGDNYSSAFPERGITPIPVPQYFYTSPTTPALYAQPIGPTYGAYAAVPPVVPRGFEHAAGNSPPAAAYGARESVGWKVPDGGDLGNAIVLAATIRAEEASKQGPCPILWDVRRPVTSATLTNATGVNPELSESVTDPPSKRLVIVCKQLPWPIYIKKYSAIRCEDVLDSVYASLQERLTVGEYYMAGPEKRRLIDAVNERVREANGSPEDELTKRKWITTRVNGHERTKLDQPYRVDILDRQVLFKGLFYDRRIIAERLAHDPEGQEDAWVLSLGETDW